MANTPSFSTKNRFDEKVGGAADQGGMMHDAAEKVKDVAGAVSESARDIAGRAGEMMSGVGSQATQAFSGAKDYWTQHDVSDMADDLSSIIRRYPIPAVLVGLGIGFLIARSTRD